MGKTKTITVFAPSTVANVGCGYDILGFAVQHYGDTLVLTEREDHDLVIQKIEGADGIPTDPDSNVTSVAIGAMMNHLGVSHGFDIEISKNIPPGSGLGSSASSSAAAVFALNEFLDRPLTTKELIPFAMEGERIASTKAHADNVAPSLLGGFTVIRSYDPLDIFNIPFPEDLWVTIIYPNVEIKTADAKRILKKQIEMSDAVTQWGNVAGLVSGLIMKDYELIGRSLQDVIVEPVRSILIPFYDQTREIAMDNGALGFNISGSGPSMFCLMREEQTATRICELARELYHREGVELLSFISKINPTGARVL